MAKKQQKTIEKTVETTDSQEFNKLNTYRVEQAIKFTKQLSRAKFDASVEVHFRLGIDPKKGEQQIRTAVSLPHGTRKTVKVAAFVSDDKIKACQEAGADFVGGEDLITNGTRSKSTSSKVNFLFKKFTSIKLKIHKFK